VDRLVEFIGDQIFDAGGFFLRFGLGDVGGSGVSSTVFRERFARQDYRRHLLSGRFLFLFDGCGRREFGRARGTFASVLRVGESSTAISPAARPASSTVAAIVVTFGSLVAVHRSGPFSRGRSGAFVALRSSGRRRNLLRATVSLFALTAILARRPLIPDHTVDVFMLL
jgi:hypothetical protein